MGAYVQGHIDICNIYGGMGASVLSPCIYLIVIRLLVKGAYAFVVGGSDGSVLGPACIYIFACLGVCAPMHMTLGTLT